MGEEDAFAHPSRCVYTNKKGGEECAAISPAMFCWEPREVFAG